MVSIMDELQASNESTACSSMICDNRSTLALTDASQLSPISQNEIDIQLTNNATNNQLIKKSLKLDLEPTRYEFIHSDKESVSGGSQEKDDEGKITSPMSPNTPKSPKTGKPVVAVRLPHQTSLTSAKEVVDDRKALRDALYQGIFHRHRRTIFAVGSFLRMLKSRNSQYNTIRSSSEGEEDTR